MSQKWTRSKQWDDRNIPPALWPVKFLLRAFSSIPLAVSLLTCVALYGTLASVPVGLIALAPTYIVYGLTLLAAIALGAAVPTRLIVLGLRKLRAAPGLRFAAGLLCLLILTAGAAWVWRLWVWPAVNYDTAIGHGLRFFASFVEHNKSTTVRRLRSMEMSELEFYGWWPLKVILLAFVANLITATVRRIEFTFHNIGVLTVHTGIVTIALGSVWYQRLKEEGDVLLMAGPVSAEGIPAPGPIETGFFDNTRVSLWANMGGGRSEQWQQRPLIGLPRYHDYNLGAVSPGPVAPSSSGSDTNDALNISVADPGDGGGGRSIVDLDVYFRVVGYGAYVDLEPTWVAAAEDGEPLRQIEFVRQGAPAGQKPPRLPFLPTRPDARINSLGGLLAVEYTRGMSETRWSDLRAAIDPGRPGRPTMHALVIEVPGQKVVQAYAVEPGTVIAVGDTGYIVEVKELLPQPPFPIVTPGYQGAQSSVAVIRVTPPRAGADARPFDRYVYHRFPEITQDILEEKNDRGMPKRRNADPGIRIGYIDASVAQVYFDEAAGPRDSNDPIVRAIVRPAGGQARVIENLRTGSSVQVAPEAFLRLGDRWDHAVRVEHPEQVPEAQRDNKLLGTHQHAAIAVEVTSQRAPGWRSPLWLPFTQYLLADPNLLRSVQLPDGRRVTMGFGRVRRALPGIALELADFSMSPYPGSEIPQDYRSDVLVIRTSDPSPPEARYTSLNDPLLVRVPFRANPGAPWIANAIAWAVGHIAPTQYKFSQAGWDQRGWTQTKHMADAGQLKRPFANFTILGVGNNPGIYVIASGAVMMSVGIPWAFYVKPLLVKARKRKIQRQVAAGEFVPRGGAMMNGVRAAHAAPLVNPPGQRSAGAKK